MDQRADERLAVGARRYAWLRRQTEVWQRHGVVGPDQAAQVLGLDDPSPGFGAARAAFGVAGLAVLMAAIALLLVVGYNWDALARGVKVAILLGTVAGTFGASAVAYARARPRLGEMLAFAGTLLYGNAIFLLAGVFHIRAHDPDGVFWWMAGTLATALLLQSRLIAATALALLLFWVPFEGAEYARPNYWFLPAAAAAAWLAARLRSEGLLGLTTMIATLWLLVTGAFAFDAGLAAFGPALALGAAYVSIGRLDQLAWGSAPHPGSVAREDGMGRALVAAGLLTVGVSLLPLMSVGVHQEIEIVMSLAWPTAVMTAIFAVIAAGLPLAGGRARSDWPILAAAGFAVGWLVTVAIVDVDRAVAIALAVGASALTLAFAIWLMRDGARGGSALQFAAGAAFALGFVAVRWASAVGSLLWSALILALASASLLWMAWLWRSALSERSESKGKEA